MVILELFLTSCVSTSSFYLERSHGLTQIGLLESQLRQGVLYLTAALKIGGNLWAFRKLFVSIIIISGIIIYLSVTFFPLADW